MGHIFSRRRRIKGFLIKSLTIDAGSGTLSAGTGVVLDKIAVGLRLIKDAGVITGRPLGEAKFDAATKRWTFTFEEMKIVMPESEVDRFTTLIANGFIWEAEELLSEFVSQGFENAAGDQEEGIR